MHRNAEFCDVKLFLSRVWMSKAALSDLGISVEPGRASSVPHEGQLIRWSCWFLVGLRLIQTPPTLEHKDLGDSPRWIARSGVKIDQNRLSGKGLDVYFGRMQLT